MGHLFTMVMDKQKINLLVFLGLWLVAGIFLVKLCLTMQSTILENQTGLSISDFLLLQKRVTLANISFFVPLLVISFVGFYFTRRKNLILLANLLYVAVTLFVYVNMNKAYHGINHQVATDQKGYWLFLFIGVFYVLGAVLVSAIGYITVRNLLNRENSSLKKGKSKKNHVN